MSSLPSLSAGGLPGDPGEGPSGGQDGQKGPDPARVTARATAGATGLLLLLQMEGKVYPLL